jgi:phenylpropionate dioxygenase-like ring-hydroxylating dioxygenase large terminal subunit
VSQHPVRTGADLGRFEFLRTWDIATSISLTHPLLKEFVKDYLNSGFMRDLPYGLELLGEKLLDVSHLPFSHHSVAGFDRDDTRPLNLRSLSLQERTERAAQEVQSVHFELDLSYNATARIPLL